MNKFWKGTIVITLIGMLLWGWITMDQLDSIRCLRMDNKAMSTVIYDLYNKNNFLEGRQNIIDETQLTLAQHDVELINKLDNVQEKSIKLDFHLADVQDQIVNVLDKTVRKVLRLDPQFAVNVGISSSLVIYSDGGHGSGFFIDKDRGIILTAGHVAKHSEDEVLHVRQGCINVPVLYSYWDSFIDVGLIFIDPNQARMFVAKNVPISYEIAKIGELIISSGYPLDAEEAPYASVGVVVGLDVNDANELGPKNEHTMKFHLEVIPGMSGGPILNTKGEIVSINSVSQPRTEISLGPNSKQIKHAIVRIMRDN